MSTALFLIAIFVILGMFIAGGCDWSAEIRITITTPGEYNISIVNGKIMGVDRIK